MVPTLRAFLAPALFLAALAPTARGFNIVLDYSYDTSGFFTTNLAAKASLEAAASRISNVITSSLGAVTSDVFTAYDPAPITTVAQLDWEIGFSHPTTGNLVTINSFTSAANEYRVFVGGRPLTGNTLGQGGPGGIVNLYYGWAGAQAGWTEAVGAAEALSNQVMGRGAGPTIDVAIGSLTFGGPTSGGAIAPVNLRVGLTVGNLWFDNDGSWAWQYDHTTPVGVGLIDFYTVALHELLHTVGVGVSQTWAENIENTTDWAGANVKALNEGSGAGLIDAGGDHIASGKQSTSIGNGLAQEVVMSPSIAPGERRDLTQLDLAFLRDLGFTTDDTPDGEPTPAPVPEPAAAAGLAGAVALACAALRRRRRASGR